MNLEQHFAPQQLVIDETCKGKLANFFFNSKIKVLFRSQTCRKFIIWVNLEAFNSLLV